MLCLSACLLSIAGTLSQAGLNAKLRKQMDQLTNALNDADKKLKLQKTEIRSESLSELNKKTRVPSRVAM
eukprot:SAG31_NODE_18581_length_630_cov_17.760829_2_plen_69_part_01